MVQGINWNSYSANQILEMKQKGVQVPDNVLKEAESTVSEKETKEITDETKDDNQVEYDIEDKNTENTTGIQSAADFKKQLAEEGASLKSMVKQFTEKANENTETLSTTLKEISGFSNFILEKQDIATANIAQAEDEQAVIREIVDDMNGEIETKEKELETVNEKIESGEATESDEAKAEELQGEIEDITQNGNSEVSAKEAVVTDLNTEAENTMSDLDVLTKYVNESHSEAQKGIDFAKETNDLSSELYQKGSKAGKIGAIVSSVVGGAIGGIGMSKLKITHNNVDLTNTSAKTNMALNITGGMAVATVMGSLGSLLGSQNRKIGQAGMEAADKLNQVANDQLKMAETVASNNDIAIETNTEANSVINNLSEEIKSAADETKVDKKEDTAATTETTDDTPASATTSEKEVDEEAKKKKEV